MPCEGNEPLRISRQIVREYLAVVTRPQTWPVAITREEALEDANRLIGGFEVLEDGPVVTESLIALCREVSVGGSQIHDANIVATMLAHGGAQAANVQHRRLSTLWRSYRVGGRLARMSRGTVDLHEGSEWKSA